MYRNRILVRGRGVFCGERSERERNAPRETPRVVMAGEFKDVTERLQASHVSDGNLISGGL